MSISDVSDHVKEAPSPGDRREKVGMRAEITSRKYPHPHPLPPLAGEGVFKAVIFSRIPVRKNYVRSV
jgi:hypothetical protein